MQNININILLFFITSLIWKKYRVKKAKDKKTKYKFKIKDLDKTAIGKKNNTKNTFFSNSAIYFI